MNRTTTRLLSAWRAMGAVGAVALGAQACDGSSPKVVGDNGPVESTGGQPATPATGGAATGGANTGGSTGGAPEPQAGSPGTSSGGSGTGGASAGGEPGAAGTPTTTKCESNDDCQGEEGPVCNTATGACVDCVADSDCEEAEFCDAPACKVDVCGAGDTQCSGDGVAQCNESGSGFGDPEACPAGQSCVETDGVAACAVTPQGQGGAGGEGGGGTIPPPDCTSATVDPCSSIPQFTGTQTVDGNGDDLCSVPSFTFDFSDEGNVIDWRGEGPYTESALVRAAWSSSALHVFITVTDSSVNAWESGNLWDADGIELLVTTNTGGNGDVAADSEALHVSASHMHAVSVLSGAPTDLPAGQHAGQTLSGGYAIELQLPWKGDAPSSGSEIRFDMTLNAANGQDGDTWRDAQAMLERGSVQGDSPCGDDVQPYCDERTWCTPTLD